MSGPADLPHQHATVASVVAYRAGVVVHGPDRLVGEEPLEIRAAGPGAEPVAVAVTMRTPGDERELAAGFLVTEGLAHQEDIAGVEYGDPAALARPDDTVVVRLSRPFDPAAIAARNFVATASCGICGRASIDGIVVRAEPLSPGPIVRAPTLLALPERLRAAQAVFERTGGLHAAGLFDAAGELLDAREDVGRHNALDKLVGAAALAGRLPLRERIVLVSGRLSFELVQKAAVAGLPLLCAVSAPSDLAVEAASRLGMSLVGFLRDDRFNVYTGPDRVSFG